MYDKDNLQRIREIELMTGPEPFVELKSFGLNLMTYGFGLMLISGICYLVILFFIRLNTSSFDMLDYLIASDVLSIVLVFLFSGLIMFIIGTLVQMKNVTESVRASQRQILISELPKVNIGALERIPDED